MGDFWDSEILADAVAAFATETAQEEKGFDIIYVYKLMLEMMFFS